jgi:hypothetical protein
LRIQENPKVPTAVVNGAARSSVKARKGDRKGV